MPTYTFSCSCGRSVDKRTSMNVAAITCECGATARREEVYAVNFGGFARTPKDQWDFREDYRRFNEASAELEYKHDRLKDAMQKPDLKPPPLYKVAKAKALDLASKGATIDDL